MHIKINYTRVLCILTFSNLRFFFPCQLICKIAFAKVKRRGSRTMFFFVKNLKQNLISTHLSLYLFVLFTLKFIAICFRCDSLNVYEPLPTTKLSHVLSLSIFLIDSELWTAYVLLRMTSKRFIHAQQKKTLHTKTTHV